MTRVRIIGIGSPCGDDRIGWEAVRALEAGGLPARYPAGAVQACCCGRPGLLPGMFAGADAAILIDAMKGGGSAGTVRRLAASELARAPGFLSSHGVGVADIVALGGALGMLPPILTLYGVEVLDTAPAARPHRRVRAAIPVLLRAIAVDLDALFAARVNVPAAARSGP